MLWPSMRGGDAFKWLDLQSNLQSGAVFDWLFVWIFECFFSLQFQFRMSKQKRPCLEQLRFVEQTKTTTNVRDDSSADAPTNAVLQKEGAVSRRQLFYFAVVINKSKLNNAQLSCSGDALLLTGFCEKQAHVTCMCLWFVFLFALAVILVYVFFIVTLLLTAFMIT